MSPTLCVQGHSINKQKQVPKLCLGDLIRWGNKNYVHMTYIYDLLVNITDEPIPNDSQALISPHTDKVLHLRESIWCGQTHTMVDPGQISQVENVVEFGWCWRQIINNRARRTKYTLCDNGRVQTMLFSRVRILFYIISQSKSHSIYLTDSQNLILYILQITHKGNFQIQDLYVNNKQLFMCLSKIESRYLFVQRNNFKI